MRKPPILLVLLVAMVLSGCTSRAQRSDHARPPAVAGSSSASPSAVSSSFAQLPPMLTDWQEIVDTYKVAWRQQLGPQARLTVGVLSVVAGEPATDCTGPTTVTPLGKQLEYCLTKPAHQGAVPDGAILVPYETFLASIHTLYDTSGETHAFMAVSIVLALLYSDHIVAELTRMGQLPPTIEPHHPIFTYCLVGVSMRSLIGARHGVSEAQWHKILDWATQFRAPTTQSAVGNSSMFYDRLTRGWQAETWGGCAQPL